MNIIVTFKHLEPTDAIKWYAESKVSKLEKYLNNIIEVHVILSMKRVQHKESGTASVKLVAKNLTINAQEESSDIYSAIDLLTAKVESQIKKHKDKLRRKNYENKNYELLEENGRFSDLNVDIVDDYEKKPLKVEEAIIKLNKKKKNFIVFKNTVSSRVAILFKKDDGNYALIEPNIKT